MLITSSFIYMYIIMCIIIIIIIISIIIFRYLFTNHDNNISIYYPGFYINSYAYHKLNIFFLIRKLSFEIYFQKCFFLKRKSSFTPSKSTLHLFFKTIIVYSLKHKYAGTAALDEVDWNRSTV